MKTINVHKHFLDGTDISLHVPEFDNFGKRLVELERLADEANPIDPAEVEVSTAQMMARVQVQQEDARKKLDAMPDGPKKQLHLQMLKMMEQMTEDAGKFEDDEEEQGIEAEEDDEAPVERDLELQNLELTLPKDIKWNEATQGAVELFFAGWPQTRLAVLQATFDYYKQIYADALTLFPTHKGLRFILPEPSAPEAIADLFYIRSIHWHRDGVIGLSGGCTWDEEHGYGCLLQNGKVTNVGAADVAFA